MECKRKAENAFKSSTTPGINGLPSIICIIGPLPYKIEAKEEKGEVVISKVQSVEETNIKQEESVANEKPIKRSPVNKTPTKTTKSQQKVLRVFGGVLFVTFIIIFFSFVREVGDGQ